MSKIAYELGKIRGIAFDVDGVLSPSTISLGPDGMPVRMVNIKDGYAMQLAVKRGLKLCIITGADTPSISVRYAALGIKDIYLKAGKKLPVFEQWCEANGFQPEEVAFVGDDVPDYECMKACGLSVCPADACWDIKNISTYISPVDGGYGVARDLIEEILRERDLWMSDAKAFGW